MQFAPTFVRASILAVVAFATFSCGGAGSPAAVDAPSSSVDPAAIPGPDPETAIVAATSLDAADPLESDVSSPSVDLLDRCLELEGRPLSAALSAEWRDLDCDGALYGYVGGWQSGSPDDWDEGAWFGDADDWEEGTWIASGSTSDDEWMEGAGLMVAIGALSGELEYDDSEGGVGVVGIGSGFDAGGIGRTAAVSTPRVRVEVDVADLDEVTAAALVDGAHDAAWCWLPDDPVEGSFEIHASGDVADSAVPVTFSGTDIPPDLADCVTDVFRTTLDRDDLVARPLRTSGTFGSVNEE